MSYRANVSHQITESQLFLDAPGTLHGVEISTSTAAILQFKAFDGQDNSGTCLCNLCLPANAGGGLKAVFYKPVAFNNLYFEFTQGSGVATVHVGDQFIWMGTDGVSIGYGQGYYSEGGFG